MDNQDRYIMMSFLRRVAGEMVQCWYVRCLTLVTSPICFHMLHRRLWAVNESELSGRHAEQRSRLRFHKTDVPSHVYLQKPKHRSTWMRLKTHFQTSPDSHTNIRFSPEMLSCCVQPRSLARQYPVIVWDIHEFHIWLVACKHIISLAITWISSYLFYEKPERCVAEISGMLRHARTLSCLLPSLCALLPWWY